MNTQTTTSETESRPNATDTLSPETEALKQRIMKHAIGLINNDYTLLPNDCIAMVRWIELDTFATTVAMAVSESEGKLTALAALEIMKFIRDLSYGEEGSFQFINRLIEKMAETFSDTAAC